MAASDIFRSMYDLPAKKMLSYKEFIQTEDNKLQTVQYIQPVAINLRKMQFFWLF